MWVPVIVGIGVGNMERLPVFVSALEDPCLLGIDFKSSKFGLPRREGKSTWPGSSFDSQR
ncbi:hypothetical protein E2C01_089559 [Portunus trituberculatus]|uniref:Uncharacterized protein n=1 Tax=Portunus trituberculatus TaxID=210409 RepID=A0A5B7JDV2_PORTR|nr:hypothetical protein [Portunus trituberculatus]